MIAVILIMFLTSKQIFGAYNLRALPLKCQAAAKIVSTPAVYLQCGYAVVIAHLTHFKDLIDLVDQIAGKKKEKNVTTL